MDIESLSHSVSYNKIWYSTYNYCHIQAGPYKENGAHLKFHSVLTWTATRTYLLSLVYGNSYKPAGVEEDLLPLDGWQIASMDLCVPLIPGLAVFSIEPAGPEYTVYNIINILYMYI